MVTNTVNQDNKRIALRGQPFDFKASFYADVAQTIPLVPLDALQYPSYTIYNPFNDVVESGVAQPVATPGSYKVAFQVPVNAPLSNDNARWRIEWLFVTPENRQVNFVEDFDVRDVVITASENREQKYITIAGQDTRAMIRLTRAPAELYVDVYPLGTMTTSVANGSLNNGVNLSQDGDSLVYYYKVPGTILLPNSAFSVMWKVLQTQNDVYEFMHQTLTALTPYTYDLVTSVRMLIDKFQKRLNTVQAYEDSDIVEYLARGNELVNAVYPTTYYPLGFAPSSLRVFIVMAAGMYGLMAQRLLEVDLAVNFSGQTINFDYDHSGALGDVISGWQSFLNENLPAVKTSITRMTTPVGTVAGRQYRWTQPWMYTYKVSSTRAGSFVGDNPINVMNRLGLLW